MTEDEFENGILILEFSTAESIRSDLKQKSCESDAIVCDICLLTDGDEGNEWFFVNDVILVFIRIVMAYPMFHLVDGCVNLVLFFVDQVVFCVQSKTYFFNR